MELSSPFGANGMEGLQILSEDRELVLGRMQRVAKGEERKDVLIVIPASEQPAPITLERLAHEYSLRDELDSTWAVRPIELVQNRGQTILVLDDPGGELLSGLVGTPMEIGRFLRVAVSVATALTKLHRQDLTHKDIKPANILVNTANDEVRLTGFGVASRLARERQSVAAPESIGGTLAYMAPEQTGRMNRSVDSRADLYSLGVTLYEMLTGSIPFTASDPMEWVHRHIARRPIPPSDRLDTVPALLSAIVMKLLAKTAEERYQTAAGVERDLRRCLAEWEWGSLAGFPLGEHDAPDRLLIPEKLYGREREIETLLASFDRIVKSGAPELVLVSGYSGIGKSSVVNELHPVLVPPHGLFASGKFDQYKRDIPYSTLAQAFQNLIRPLLGKNDTELRSWRDALTEAVGANGRLMTDLVPELKLIIGDQPPVPELSPQDARRRFQRVFQKLIGVFARPEHPLALFLDDLQWLDAATLDLIEDLLTGSDQRHLMLIGAYRDNEVDDSHPLRRKLDAIKGAGGKVAEITLSPLDREHLGQLIADALRCDIEHAAPLAQMVQDKTGGNPFFAIRFFASLADEGMLTFDHDAARWSWDIDSIHAKRYTDNIVDLMVGRLVRLPPETQQALQFLACLGNVAPVGTLSIALEAAEERVHEALWPSIREELVERDENSYKFIHDRVQEAAYLLLPEGMRAETHLRIGRLLAANTPAERRDEAVFEIVAQFDRGIELIISHDERDKLAELYLIAGKRAKAAAAYAAALKYLISGGALLAEDCWERRHDLAFALALNRAECEYLTGALAEAEQRLIGLSQNAVNTVERASVACLHIDIFQALGQLDRAIAIGLGYLRQVGIEWPANPTREDARREYEKMREHLGSRTIKDAVDLPLMVNPELLATVDVLTKVNPPATLTDQNLLCLIICRVINLSLELGNCDASCMAYVCLPRIAGPRFGDYDFGFQFGQLGLDLVERRGLKRFQANTYLCFSVFVVRWLNHVRACRDLVKRATEAAKRNGDLTIAAYCGPHANSDRLFASEPLSEVQREAQHTLEFAQKAQFGFVIPLITVQLALVRTLRGLTPKFGCFDWEQFEERQLEDHFTGHPALAVIECWYWVRKLQARYLAEKYPEAIEALLKAQPVLWSSVGCFEDAEYHFYGGLCLAASYSSLPAEERAQHLDGLAAHQRQLKIWADNCPENFENRAALVGAEIARIEGRELDAERLYEAAIKSARENEFVNNEAVANELAARFYAARGFETIATAYLREARSCYHRWGADGKVRQLDGLYPHLAASEGRHSAASIGSAIEHLDTASVVEASQALSGEIELPKLIERLMTIAIENAGADRGLLILPSEDEYQIRAAARTNDDHIDVTMYQEPITGIACPESLVRYVIRSRESMILDDASRPNMFSDDDYLRKRQLKSILCLPLIKQQQLIGILLLENTLTSHAFTADRIAVLELIGAQAAISLENSRLYGELLRAGADLQLQVELLQQLPVSAWTLKPDGTPDFVNQVWLEFAGQTIDFVRSHPEAWMTAVHPEDREFAAKSFWKGVQSGQGFAFETRTLRAQDGVYRRHLQQAVVLRDAEGKVLKFVGTTTDIDDQKRAEEALRQAAAELAHANRVATMGQLSASIAHEVSQPVGAALINAETAFRWLARQPPNLEEVRQSIDRSIIDGKRAVDILRRIRDFSKKAPGENEELGINEAILEIVTLARTAMSDHGVLLKMQLSEGQPRILGDRVQLQQVILNLIMNAIEAMSEITEGPRELSITTSEVEEGGVLVAIGDSGPGLANPERVFDAFYTTKASGLGMGLSICRSIIQDHGGKLWATPNEPRGAVFCMELPVGDKLPE